MPYRLKGILKLPNSAQVAAGVDIEFISRRNYSPLLMDLSSVIKTSPTGAYDITLEYGEYAVVLYWGCNQPSHIGKLFVFADTLEGLDLQTLLQQADWQPATPEYVQQIQEWLAEASSAASSAIDSAAKAKASELLVEEGRAEVASNKTIVVNAQTDVTSKHNDVTAKAQQVATNTATVNEKTPLAVAAADTASQKAASAAASDASARDAATRAENAATAMTGALLDGGQCNLSGGIYPPPLTVGGKKYSTVWYVQVGGVVGGTSFDAGDVLRYTASTNSYFKVDAVDTTTAQINAHKVDPSAHAINTIVGLQEALNDKYGPSNRPTAADVGAVPINTTSGALAAAYYRSSNASAVGTRIRLPAKANEGQMVSFTVRVYQSSQTADIQFSGLLSAANNQWHLPKAIMICGSRSIEVKMGRDANGYAYVWVGGGNYRGVAALDVVSGNAIKNWNTDWVMSESNDTPDMALNTTIHPPYSPHNKPTAADAGADAAGTAASLITQHEEKLGAHNVSGVSGLSDELNLLKSRISELESWPKTGSNANGSWTKHRDGSMECWIGAPLNWPASSPYVSLHQSTISWRFPEEFISAPVVTAGGAQWGNGASWVSVAGAPTSTAATLRYLDVSPRDAAVIHTQARAIGRWRV